MMKSVKNDSLTMDCEEPSDRVDPRDASDDVEGDIDVVDGECFLLAGNEQFQLDNPDHIGAKASAGPAAPVQAECETKTVLVRTVLEETKTNIDPATQLFLEGEAASDYHGFCDVNTKKISDDMSKIRGKANLITAIASSDLESLLSKHTAEKLRKKIYNGECQDWGQVLCMLCVFVEISKRLMKDQPLRTSLGALINSLQTALRDQPATWIKAQGGWNSYMSPAEPPNIQQTVAVFMDNGEPFLVFVYDSLGKSGSNLSDKLTSEVSDGFRKGHSSPPVYVCGGDGFSDPRQEIRFYAQFTNTVFVIFITPNSLKNKISAAYEECLSYGDSGGTRKHLIIPVEIFKLKSRDYPVVFKPYRTLKAFPNTSWKASEVRDFVGLLKGHYDSLITEQLKDQFEVNKEYQLDIKVIVTIKTSKINDLDRKQVTDNIKSHTKGVLEDPWTTLRQQLLHMYHIRNLRIVDVAGTDHLVLELLTLQATDIDKLVNNFHNGMLASVFPDHIKMPEVREKFAFSVSLDVDKAKELIKKLKKSPDPPSHPAAQVLAGIMKAKIEDEAQNDVADITTLLQQKKSLHPHIKAATQGGRNMLHMIVASSRAECFKVIFYSNLWEPLRLQMIDPSQDTQYGGYSPRGLAEKFLFKSKGPGTLEEYDHYDQLWLTMPVLHKACLAGSHAFVRVLLETCTDVNALDSAGAPCIHYACAVGAVNTIKLLIDRGANPKLENHRGESALTLAAMFSQTEAVRALLARFDFSTPTVDHKKYRPMDYAAISGDTDTLEAFSSGGVAPDERLVTLAARHKRLAAVKKLVLENRLGVRGRDDDGRTPLLNAAAKGQTQIISFLLENDLHTSDTAPSILLDRDDQNRNCLHMVAEHGHGDTASCLLEVAKQRLQQDNKRYIIEDILNSRNFYSGRERLMIVRGRDRGRKAWHYLSIKRTLSHSFKKKMSSGQIDVKLFGDILCSGFGPNPPKKKMDETEANLVATVKQCLPDMTALVTATYYGHREVAVALLKEGARSDLVDHFSNSALHYVGMRGDLELARCLEQQGADVSALNLANKTPADVAEDNEHISVVNFVRAKELFKHARRFQTCMADKKDALSERTLGTLRTEGKDIRRHLISTLRDLTIDINKVLLDLGSGPVQEESLDAQSGQTSETGSRTAFAGMRGEMAPFPTSESTSLSGGVTFKSSLETDSAYVNRSPKPNG